MAIDITYDAEADALYIKLSDARAVQGADAGPLVLDHSADGKVIGIEVLAASTVLAPGDWSKSPPPGVVSARVKRAAIDFPSRGDARYRNRGA